MIDPPRQVEAHLMGYQQAEFILGCPNSDCAESPPTPEPAEALVWLVTLEGRWQLVGGPAATPTPTVQPPFPTGAPVYFYRCQTIIDATTGEAGPILNF